MHDFTVLSMSNIRIQSKKRVSSIALNNRDPLQHSNFTDSKIHGNLSTPIAMNELSINTEECSKRPVLKDISNLVNHNHGSITVKVQKNKKKTKPEQSYHKSYKGHRSITAILHYSPLSSSLCSTKIYDFESTYSDYGDDIYNFLCQLQKRYSPHPFPLEHSHSNPEYGTNNNAIDDEEITPNMRRILVDWLSEVVEDYHLKIETFHLATNYLDRYLSVKTVPKAYLQLLGASSLLIASKFEESCPCRIKELVEVCNGCYTIEQIGLMERKIITTLEFGLHAATIHTFIYCILAKKFINDYQLYSITQDKSRTYFIQFLSELCLSNYELLQYSYEEISRAILHIALLYLNRSQKQSQRSSSFFILCQQILDMITDSYYETVPGIVSKYSSERYQNIAYTNLIYCNRYDPR